MQDFNVEQKALFGKRQIMFSGSLYGEMQAYICASIVYLNALDEKTPMTLFIDSRGGQLELEQMCMDVIAASKVPVHGVVIGECFSAAFSVLQACHKRLAYPHARLRFHAPEIKWQVDNDPEAEIAKLRVVHDEQVQLFAKRSKQPEAAWRAWAKEARTFLAPEALSLGIIDEIVPTDTP
jgi:ATP-dependent Clp protease, protease subunit